MMLWGWDIVREIRVYCDSWYINFFQIGDWGWSPNEVNIVSLSCTGSFRSEPYGTERQVCGNGDEDAAGEAEWLTSQSWGSVWWTHSRAAYLMEWFKLDSWELLNWVQDLEVYFQPTASNPIFDQNTHIANDRWICSCKIDKSVTQKIIRNGMSSQLQVYIQSSHSTLISSEDKAIRWEHASKHVISTSKHIRRILCSIVTKWH